MYIGCPEVRIGEDPWIGCKVNFKLSKALTYDLHSTGIF
jgi:hypothetical protein